MCAALAELDPAAPEVMLIAVGGDEATDIYALRILLARGVARLSLQRRVIIVTAHAAAADLARKSGVKAVALVPGYPSTVALKWAAAYTALTAGCCSLNPC